MSEVDRIAGETECAVTLAVDATTKTTAKTWLGFLLMCLGMFMAILDIQVVATSLPAIQEALGISRDAMSWIQTAYLIAEIIAIPLTGWLTRVSDAALAVRRRDRPVHAGLDRLRAVATIFRR